MSVTLGNDVYYYWLLKAYEFPEVEYDNILPEEERLDKARIQQRKIAEDYWNYVKDQRKDKLIAEEADGYLKKTLEIINTSDTEVSSAVMEATQYIPYLKIEFPSKNAAANTANTDANAAKTGDQMNLPLLIGVMIAAAFAGILTVCMRRRKTSVK